MSSHGKGAVRRPGAGRHRRGRQLLVRVVLVLLISALAAAAALWWTLPDVSELREENPESTAFIELRRSEAEAAGEPFELRWKWRRLGQISRYLRAAVVLSEDPKFWQHAGIDWQALRAVAEESWDAKKLTRGGSTITQQLAKNLYLSPSRSPIRKLREFFIARRLEKELSKQRILEIYLNIAEWGDGVFGAQAAAQRWYGRSAASLSPAQAVRLAVALPNPFVRNPRARSRQLTRRAARLLIEMRRSGLLSKSQYLAAREEIGSPSPSAKKNDEIAMPVEDAEGEATADAPADEAEKDDSDGGQEAR